jgi:branched-subunit amino acid aminotransferase/4-amino-4-deoxychorismate lyase
MIPNDFISSHDRLALFGFGVFETLIVYDEGPLFLDLHWTRMHEGANFLNLKLPSKNEWIEYIHEFITKTSAIYPYALRITLSGGSPSANLSPQLFFNVRPLPYKPEQYRNGISLSLLPSPRNERSPLVGIKSANYLENLLAKEYAFHQGSDEGLWLNTQGYLTEGTMSNLFFLKSNKLLTPSLAAGCLSGTRRRIVLQLAEKLNIDTEEGFYTLEDLLVSDEIFMTNALMGIMPVRRVDTISKKVLLQCESSVTRKLELAYKKLIRSEYTSFENK